MDGDEKKKNGKRVLVVKQFNVLGVISIVSGAVRGNS